MTVVLFVLQVDLVQSESSACNTTGLTNQAERLQSLDCGRFLLA